MPKSELEEMGEMIARIQSAGETVGAAIERTEHELKVLRTIKASLGVKPAPKPRTKKETVTA